MSTITKEEVESLIIAGFEAEREVTNEKLLDLEEQIEDLQAKVVYLQGKVG